MLQVYGYRKSLWSEHLGKFDPSYEEPEELKCVQSVNSIADENWSLYTVDEVVPLKSHIVKYPILVKDNGEVEPLPGWVLFPDVGGKVLQQPSSFSTSLPSELTT